MDNDTAGRIAGTAVQLKNKLTAMGVGSSAVNDWVAAAMPAIVTYEAALGRWAGQPAGPRPLSESRSRGEVTEEASVEPPRAAAEISEEAAYWYYRQRGGQPLKILRSRVGNVTDLAGLRPEIIEQLAAGPEQDGTGMRLVAVAGLSAGAAAETAAFRWVRDNVPAAGLVLNATYAGRIARDAASPVYLVTYQLAASQDDGGPAHPVRDTDELPS